MCIHVFFSVSFHSAQIFFFFSFLPFRRLSPPGIPKTAHQLCMCPIDLQYFFVNRSRSSVLTLSPLFCGPNPSEDLTSSLLLLLLLLLKTCYHIPRKCQREEKNEKGQFYYQCILYSSTHLLTQTTRNQQMPNGILYTNAYSDEIMR